MHPASGTGAPQPPTGRPRCPGAGSRQQAPHGPCPGNPYHGMPASIPRCPQHCALACAQPHSSVIAFPGTLLHRPFALFTPAACRPTRAPVSGASPLHHSPQHSPQQWLGSNTSPSIVLPVPPTDRPSILSMYFPRSYSVSSNSGLNIWPSCGEGHAGGTAQRAHGGGVRMGSWQGCYLCDLNPGAGQAGHGWDGAWHGMSGWAVPEARCIWQEYGVEAAGPASVWWCVAVSLAMGVG